MNDRLGVATRAEAVAGALERSSQLDVVVDLAVEHHVDARVLVADRLPAALEVDEAQAPAAEPGAER